MDKRKAQAFEDCEFVYLGGSTVLLVKHGRVVGMYILYTEPPFGQETAETLRIRSVRT